MQDHLQEHRPETQHKGTTVFLATELPHQQWLHDRRTADPARTAAAYPLRTDEPAAGFFAPILGHFQADDPHHLDSEVSNLTVPAANYTQRPSEPGPEAPAVDFYRVARFGYGERIQWERPGNQRWCLTVASTSDTSEGPWKVRVAADNYGETVTGYERIHSTFWYSPCMSFLFGGRVELTLTGPLFGRAPHSSPNPTAQSAMGGFSFPARGPAPSGPATPISLGTHGRSKSVNRAFEFSPTPSPGAGDLVPIHLNGTPQIDLEDERLQSTRIISAIISAQSVCGETPRSSGEFYAISNSTTETLLSEYDPKGQSRLLRTPHNRRHSLLSIGPKMSESLMMGYAHVIGSFTLDGSLIQTGIFEDVKRKGVLGTQSGGGVVGLESSKNDGGFLSGLGWGGLSGLLGGGGMSSIAEMKNTASK